MCSFDSIVCYSSYYRILGWGAWAFPESRVYFISKQIISTTDVIFKASSLSNLLSEQTYFYIFSIVHNNKSVVSH